VTMLPFFAKYGEKTLGTHSGLTPCNNSTWKPT
jgi:hypothetical protein